MRRGTPAVRIARADRLSYSGGRATCAAIRPSRRYCAARSYCITGTYRAI